MHDLVVMPQKTPLTGSVPAPPDEDVGHLALLVAALADGASEIRRLSRGPDVAALIDALQKLGIAMDEGTEAGTRVVHGAALRGLAHPGQPVSCGRSTPTLRRLAAVLVAHPFRSVLTTETTEPWQPIAGMQGIAAALRRRAAQIEGVFSPQRAGAIGPPFVLGPLAQDRALCGIECELTELRPDVKEALLLSGLYADETTYVREHIVTRDHLERMLAALDVPVRAAGPIVALDPRAGKNDRIAPFSFDVPGDIAAASVLACAATLVAGSRVCVRGVGLNATRSGAFDLLRQMGGDVELAPQATRLGETEGTVCASHVSLRAMTMAGEPLLRATDDLPVLVALAARARGPSEIDTAFLRDVEDPERGETEVRRMVAVLRLFGVEAELGPGGLVVSGRPEGPLEGADIDAMGSASLAAMALILGLLGGRPTRVRQADAIAVRYPRLIGTLRALGADVRVESAAG